jgi:hypothetical protein
MGLRTGYLAVSSACLVAVWIGQLIALQSCPDEICLAYHHALKPLFRMHLPGAALLLRIFIGESDQHRHRPLYEAIFGRELNRPSHRVVTNGASSRFMLPKSYNFPWICL